MQREKIRFVMLSMPLASLLLLASAPASAQEQTIEGEWSDWNTSPDACESAVEHIDADGQTVRSRGYAFFASGPVDNYHAELYEHGEAIADEDVPENEEIRAQAVCFQQPNNHGESVLDESEWGKSVRFKFCPDDYPYIGVIPGQNDQQKVWVRCQIRAHN